MKTRLIHGNSRKVLSSFPSESVDLVITSPPYKSEDRYSTGLIQDVFQECFRIQKDASLLFLNFGHLAGAKSRPFEVVTELERIGYFLEENIIWLKTQFSPIQGCRRLNNLTEFIFMFSCRGRPKLNRLSIGVPYKDKSNIKRYALDDLRCGGNLWKFGYETIQSRNQKLHPDRFPEELPRRCIKLSGISAGSVVLDPFSGSGTTCFVAEQMGMFGIGIELELENYETSLLRHLSRPCAIS